jgi:glutaredoxin
MMKIIRIVLGFVLVTLDKLFSPRPLKITEDQKQSILNNSKSLELFEFNACPFCIKVRRFMKKNNINIDLKDAKNDLEQRNELLNNGGKIQVPCLKISKNESTQWLYESSDIIKYLEKEVLPN